MLDVKDSRVSSCASDVASPLAEEAVVAVVHPTRNHFRRSAKVRAARLYKQRSRSVEELEQSDRSRGEERSGEAVTVDDSQPRELAASLRRVRTTGHLEAEETEFVSTLVQVYSSNSNSIFSTEDFCHASNEVVDQIGSSA